MGKGFLAWWIGGVWERIKTEKVRKSLGQQPGKETGGPQCLSGAFYRVNTVGSLFIQEQFRKSGWINSLQNPQHQINLFD